MYFYISKHCVEFLVALSKAFYTLFEFYADLLKKRVDRLVTRLQDKVKLVPPFGLKEVLSVNHAYIFRKKWLLNLWWSQTLSLNKLINFNLVIKCSFFIIQSHTL